MSLREFVRISVQGEHELIYTSASECCLVLCCSVRGPVISSAVVTVHSSPHTQFRRVSACLQLSYVLPLSACLAWISASSDPVITVHTSARSLRAVFASTNAFVYRASKDDLSVTSNCNARLKCSPVVL